MACSTCQNFQQGRDLLYIKRATIESTATAGCPYCDILKQCIHGMFDVDDIKGIYIKTILGRSVFHALFGVSLRENSRPKDPRFGVGYWDRIEEIVFSIPNGNFPISFTASNNKLTV
jgi:hypothetical protein